MQQKISISKAFIRTRKDSEEHCVCLEPDDYNLQAITETSPVKWHLAHTSWFFETFILKQFEQNFSTFDKSYEVLFNSYYNSIGEQYPRDKRYLIKKPSVEQVFAYRANITKRMLKLIDDCQASVWQEIEPLILLGINHEQQHQELFFSDLLYNLHQQAEIKSYQQADASIHNNSHSSKPPDLDWISLSPGLIEIGRSASDQGFAFDNEFPRHKYWLEPFQISNRLITNGEYLEFIKDGGYKKPRLWLADGWARVTNESWIQPLYWRMVDTRWFEYGLQGLLELDLNKPVSHISAYEADAFARWKGTRLLTEQEWEYASQQITPSKLAREENIDAPVKLEPSRFQKGNGLQQMHDELWQWTSSSYQAYPGFKEDSSSIGEYNGKFMCNQLVLKGGSCVTPSNHIRNTYRNFFYPETRWQFSGIRLARNIKI